MTYQNTLQRNSTARPSLLPGARDHQETERAVLSCLDNIRRDLLRCVEDGNYTTLDGERIVECVSIVPYGCYNVAVELIPGQFLIPEPTWQTTFEINPAQQENAALLFSQLTSKAAREGILILKFVAVYSDSNAPAVYGIPVTLHRKTNPGNWHLAVQDRVVID